MDPETDFPDLIEDYEANIDDLSLALRPLLTTPLHTTTSTLPLLDKAKLQVLTAYAIESLLYNVLQASNIPAKEHAVFPELARLKGYFGKIKEVETLYGGAEGGESGGRGKLDKEAAARFIRHGLAGNDKFDFERQMRLAREKAKASVKIAQLHKKFDQADEDKKQAELAAQRKEVAKRKAAELGAVEDEDESEDEIIKDAEDDSSASQKNHVDSENEDFYGTSTAAPEPSITTTTPTTLIPQPTASTTTTTTTTKTKKSKKEDRKRRKTTDDPTRGDKADKAARRAKKLQRRLEKAQSAKAKANTEELVVPAKNATAPKSRSQTFSALLDGSFAEGKKNGTKGKK